jgi:glycosyltransferase involved in cell wall biosynthesis
MTKTKVHLTSLLFDFGRGSVTANLSVEWALGFRDLGFEPELYGHGEFMGTAEYRGVYREIPCQQFSGLLPLPGFLSRRVKYLASAFRYARYVWFNHREIALIFATSTHAWPLLLQILAAKSRGIPLVYYFVEEPVSLHRPGTGCSLRARLRWWVDLVFEHSFLYGIVLRLCTGVACITQELADKLRGWKYRPSTILVAPNVKHGSSVVSSSTMSHGAGEFVLFYGGALDEEKEALFELLQAALSLSQRHPSLRIFVAGSGRSATKLSSYLAQQENSQLVTYAGQLPWSQLRELLANADLCVVLKRHHTANLYNFPNKITDYMAQGKAMLVSDLPLHRRLFEDRVSALFAQPEDPASIARAIDWAITNRLLLTEIGRRAASLLRTQLDATRHCQNILRLAGTRASCLEMPKPDFSRS